MEIVETAASLLSIYRQRILNLDDSDDLSTDGLLVLLSRDMLADRRLTFGEQEQVDQLDRELIRRADAFRVVLPNFNFLDDRRRWWWFLHEGPQVKQEAEKAVG